MARELAGQTLPLLRSSTSHRHWKAVLLTFRINRTWWKSTAFRQAEISVRSYLRVLGLPRKLLEYLHISLGVPKKLTR